MAITISCPDAPLLHHEYQCQRAEWPEHNDKCPDCDGTGTVKIPYHKGEIMGCATTMLTALRAIGINNPEPAGEIPLTDEIFNNAHTMAQIELRNSPSRLYAGILNLIDMGRTNNWPVIWG